MPQAHRRDLVGVAFVAVLSSVYFVTLGILLQPIPSRSLAGTVPIPHTVASFAQWREATVAFTPHVLPRRSRLRARTLAPLPAVGFASTHEVQPLAAVQLASFHDLPAGADRTRSTAAAGEKHPNALGRFFRGVFRTVQPAGPKPEIE